MRVRSCERCRRLFQTTGNAMCPECVHELDKQFNLVKIYLYDHPGANMEQLCEDTGVDQHYVVRWLREGRLVTGDHSVMLLKCSTCGKPIHAGMYCDACKANLRRTLESTARSMTSPSASGRVQKTEEERRKESRMHSRSDGK